jgi:hypothetical protein
MLAMSPKEEPLMHAWGMYGMMIGLNLHEVKLYDLVIHNGL